MSLLPILPTMPKTPFLNEYRCLNNTILVGHTTHKSQPFKKIQPHLMADIHFTNTKKKKFKSPTVGDLKRSPTVALA